MKTIKRIKRMTLMALALSILVLPLANGTLPTVHASEASTKNEPKIIQIVSPDFPLALDDEGNVWCMAYHAISTKEGFHPVPMVKVKGVDHVVRLSRLAIKQDGTVWSIDRKNGPELNNIYEHESYIEGDQIPYLKHIVQAEAYGEIGIAIDTDGKVWFFQYAPRFVKNTPTFSIDPEPILLTTLDGIQEISSGTTGFVFLKDDGSVWTIDYNSLRTNYISFRKWAESVKPVPLEGLSDIIKIGFDIALKKDGSVWTWGSGALAKSVSGGSDGNPPSRVAGLSDFVDFSSTSEHALFLKRDGTVWGWGYFTVDWESVGQAPTRIWKEPSKMDELSNVVSITAGQRNSELSADAAVKEDGTLWMWGVNNFNRVDPQPRQVQFRLD